jgi:hypothetical protein
MRITVVGVALVALLGAMPVAAQQLDSRWAPWLGCWTLSGEQVRVCVSPADDQRGVILRTYVDAGGAESQTPVLEQTLVADGARHAIAEAECRGHQSAEWASTAERLFARAELTCSDGAARAVSGLSMITADGIWIDIQGIEIAGRENIRVRRYERGGRQVRLKPDATYDRSTYERSTPERFTIDDVTEVASRVSPRVLEAALVETRAGFALTSDALRRLQRAGVAPGVIDTMVALSYPRHFIVERPNAQDSGAFAPIDPSVFGSPWAASSTYPYYGSYWDPFWSPYVYAPFGYAYWASYGGGYFPYSPYLPSTGFVQIDGPEREDVGAGRAINGVGYTRIREREVVERGDSGVSSVSGGQSSTGGSSGSGGGSSVSSGGYSSGGSSGGGSSGGGGGGRTAQPR